MAKKGKLGKIILIVIAIWLVTTIFSGTIHKIRKATGTAPDSAEYDRGVALVEEGRYEEALDVFDALRKNDRDAYKFYETYRMENRCHGALSYAEALEYVEIYDYATALAILTPITDFEDAKTLCAELLDSDLSLSLVGEYGEGGIIFGSLKPERDGWTFMEVDPISRTGRLSEKSKDVATSSDVGRGKTNTELIARVDNTSEALDICLGHDAWNCDDWFLPSIDELELIYGNLKVPEIVDFPEDLEYWSSTYYPGGTTAAYSLSMDSGRIHGSSKATECYVLPVRYFKVPCNPQAMIDAMDLIKAGRHAEAMEALDRIYMEYPDAYRFFHLDEKADICMDHTDGSAFMHLLDGDVRRSADDPYTRSVEEQHYPDEYADDCEWIAVWGERNDGLDPDTPYVMNRECGRGWYSDNFDDDGECRWQLLISPYDIAFRIWKSNDRILDENSFYGTDYEVTAIDETDGSEMDARAQLEGDMILIDRDDLDYFLDMLCQEHEISFCITSEEQEFRFSTVDTYGMPVLLDDMFASV